MNEETFHRLGEVLDELERIMPDSYEYESDIREAYKELDDVYIGIKEVFGYKDNSDEGQLWNV